MRKRIGIFGGGMKPFHKGHYNAVLEAANENDVVYLFVSNKGRTRKGEVAINWEDMEQVWEKYLKKALPKNAKIFYVPNPTSAIYNLLEDADKNEDDYSTYTIYGRMEDLQKYYKESTLERVTPRLFANDQVELKDVTVPGSATEMRQHLANGDLKSFTAGLPEPVQRYGEEIFNLLSS